MIATYNPVQPIQPGTGKKKKDGGGRHPRGGQGNPPQVEVTAVRPPEDQPKDYANEQAVYSSGGLGPVQTYHYDRQPTYREQYAAELNQGGPAAGPGQGSAR